MLMGVDPLVLNDFPKSSEPFKQLRLNNKTSFEIVNTLSVCLTRYLQDAVANFWPCIYSLIEMQSAYVPDYHSLVFGFCGIKPTTWLV